MVAIFVQVSLGADPLVEDAKGRIPRECIPTGVYTIISQSLQQHYIITITSSLHHYRW